MQQKKTLSGLTLVETLAALGIFSLALGVVFVFISQGLKAQNMNISQIIAQNTARKAFKKMAKEIRGATYSNRGDYPIEKAEKQTLIFYTNVDDDDDAERIKYFLDGNELKREIIEPTGYPPKYEEPGEISTLASYVVNGTDPIFTYYDSSYEGTNPPMDPVDIGKIRLIHLSLQIDVNPNRTPPPLHLETEIQIRNLKDNL